MANKTVDSGWALSPLDGRYRKQTFPLADYLSEEAINRLRLLVEVEWLIYVTDHHLISGLPSLTEDQMEYLRSLPATFTVNHRERLAELENQTRHDVKAVEYLLREHLADGGLGRYSEAAHLLATSEDVNNLSVALGVKGAIQEVWVPAAEKLVDTLRNMASALANVPMLSRTHGQSATPTTLGKELAVFAWRLARQLKRIRNADYFGKFNGATGTYSAHVIALPQVDWQKTSREFVESLGLTWNPLTTQIESHDWQGELYSSIAHFNRICHNLATDMWTYISLGYFQQDLAAQGSTGSSTMPHKVNPIRFENAESNLELSSALLDVLTATLSTSRMQRDLSDSSTQRNIGVALGYSLVALDNLTRGLSGVSANKEKLAEELERHWEVLSEAIQQALRIQALSAEEPQGDDSAVEPYELLKELTRGKTVDKDDIARIVSAANLDPDLAARLFALTPPTYIGLAPNLTEWAEG